MASPNFPPVFYEQPAYSYDQPQSSVFWNGHSWQQKGPMYFDWLQQYIINNTVQTNHYYTPYYQQQQSAQSYEHFPTPQVLPSCSSILVPLTDTPAGPSRNSSPLSVPTSTMLEELLGNCTPLPTTQTASSPQTTQKSFDCQPMNGYYPGEIPEPPPTRPPSVPRKRPKSSQISNLQPVDTDWIKQEIVDDEIMIIEPSSKRIKTEIDDSLSPAAAQEPVSEFPSGDDAVFADVLAAAGLSPSDLDEIGTQAVQQQASQNCFWQTNDTTQADRYPEKNSVGFCGKCSKDFHVPGSFRQHMRAHVGSLLLSFEEPHLAISQFMEELANTKNHQILNERNPLCQLCSRLRMRVKNYTGCLYLGARSVRVHLNKCHLLEDMDLCFPPWTPEQLDKFHLNFGLIHMENMAPVAAKKKPSLKSKITGDCRLMIRRQFSDQNRDNQQSGGMFPAQSDLDLLTRFENFLADQTAGNEVLPDDARPESRCSSVGDKLVIDIAGEENVQLDPSSSCLDEENRDDSETILPRLILSDLLPRQNRPDAAFPVSFAYNDTEPPATSSEEPLLDLHATPPAVTAPEEEAPQNLHTAPFSVAITEETIQNLNAMLRTAVAEEEPLTKLHTAPLPDCNPTTQVEQLETNIPPKKQYPLSLWSGDHKLPQVSVPGQVVASLLDGVCGQIDGDFTQIITENQARSVTERSVFDNMKKVAKTKAAREWKLEKKLAKLTDTHGDLIDRLIRFPGDFSCRRAHSEAQEKI